MFAVTHGHPYEGVDVVAICDDYHIAKSIAKEVEDSLPKYSMDTIQIVSFATNRLYEAGVALDLTEDKSRTHYGNW